jgi:hypothetical protein
VGADTEGFRRGVHADEDDVRRVDALLHRRGEKQVPTPRLAHKVVETRLIDGQFIGIPGRDAFGIEVHHIDADVRAFGGDHRHGGAADIAGADATNSHGWGERVRLGLFSEEMGDWQPMKQVNPPHKSTFNASFVCPKQRHASDEIETRSHRAMRPLLLLLLALCPAFSAAPPNIIFILADDFGYGDLGCMGARTSPRRTSTASRPRA